MAQMNDIACYKGEAILATFTMTPATDITGWTITFTLRRHATDAAVLLQKSCGVFDAVNGKFQLALSKAETTLGAGDYVYDIQRVDSGSEAVLSIGRFHVAQEVLTP
jgi:hypothetical protein